MSMLDEVASYMEANGLGTVQSDLFLGSLPDEPDTCLAIYRYGGPPPNGGFDTPGLFDEMPGLQVKARGADDPTAESLIERAYRELSRIQGTKLLGTVYRMVRPQQSPFKLEVDTRDRSIYVVNFLVEKEMSLVVDTEE